LEELQAGDFLVRGLQGADVESGALAMGDLVKVGDRLRFMVRDQRGAMQDLEQHLQDYKRTELAKSFTGGGSDSAFGAVLFACNGRGQGLFAEPNYDSATFASYIPVPVR
jgi:small ligand-binding sensory domain FIST